ncbi:MAG: hypothetical protein K1060chlam1_00199 [Candidatus Anoxychlamydiales bacterium]|nr:hypothetical protein [Candidatus Anoxychlamydiales bacterium]
MFSRITSFFILPSQLIGTRFKKLLPEYLREDPNTKREALQNRFNGEEFFIETKDRAKLNGMLFKNESSQNPKEKKIWINFGGNGFAYEFFDHKQIERIKSLGFDVLTFNYRLVVKSKGKLSQKGLIEDGRAIIEYANKLGYKNIYIHAHSLGGSVATKAVASLKDEKNEAYDKIKLIVDRTFSSIKAVLKTYNFPYIIKWIVIKIVNFTNWNIKVRKDWEKIDINKCLFHAPKDEMIKKQGALYRKVKDTTEKRQLVELNYRHFNNLTTYDMQQAISIVG